MLKTFILLSLIALAVSEDPSDALFSPRDLIACTLSSADGSTGTTTATFDFYVAVGYLDESIPENIAQEASENMWQAADLHVNVCQTEDSPVQPKTSNGGRKLAVETVTLVDVATTDYLCPFGLRNVVNRTNTKACCVIQSTLSVEMSNDETIENVAETLRYALLRSTSFNVVFEAYDRVSFLDYLGDSVNANFPLPDSPLKSDFEGQITASQRGGDGDSRTGLAIGLGVGIPLALVAGIFAVHKRNQRNA